MLNNRNALSAFVIVAVGSIVYYPALAIGFWTDDYSFLESAGRLGFIDYWISYLDPRIQWHWYRPMQGLEWWIAYHLFGSDPTGYHVMQLGLHLLNAGLLYYLVRRVTTQPRLALVAALIYVTLPVDNLAVLWVAVADPLVSFFYLATLALWLTYVETERRRWFALAFAAFLSALMSKEIAATLPVTLFLADRLLVGKPAALHGWVRRYALFVFALLIYGLIELNVLTHGVFAGSLGYGIGAHIVPSLIQHLIALAFPWGLEPPLSYFWLLFVFVLIGFAAAKREWSAVFLVAAMVLAMLPVLPFPSNMASAPRYLYLSLMGSMVGVALIFELVARLGGKRWHWVAWGISLAIALLLFSNGAALAETAVNFGGTAREVRIQFRPIVQSYSAFPQDTLLYFINPPMESPYISGLLFLHYGKNVMASGVDTDRRADLASHNAAWIFYQDDEKRWQGLPVAKDVSARATTALPARFAGMIAFEGFEIANDKITRGQSIGLILYWRAAAKPEKDYTLFAHLVNARGETLAGTDGPPHQGTFPTSAWRANELVPDGITIPIERNVPPGEYTLQIGMYELDTMKRLPLINADGQPVSNTVIIAPIWISE